MERLDNKRYCQFEFKLSLIFQFKFQIIFQQVSLECEKKRKKKQYSP